MNSYPQELSTGTLPVELIAATRAILEANKLHMSVINELLVEDNKTRNLLSNGFDGHICILPKDKKLIINHKFICFECHQRWRVATRWDKIKMEFVLHWKMYGRDIFTVG